MPIDAWSHLVASRTPPGTLNSQGNYTVESDDIRKISSIEPEEPLRI